MGIPMCSKKKEELYSARHMAFGKQGTRRYFPISVTRGWFLFLAVLGLCTSCSSKESIALRASGEAPFVSNPVPSAAAANEPPLRGGNVIDGSTPPATIPPHGQASPLSGNEMERDLLLPEFKSVCMLLGKNKCQDCQRDCSGTLARGAKTPQSSSVRQTSNSYRYLCQSGSLSILYAGEDNAYGTRDDILYRCRWLSESP